MKLYLVQHGPATTKEENPDRPLTAAGHALVGRVAETLAQTRAVRPSEIRHSGKLRARESAEALATGLGLDVAIAAAPSLGPNDDPQDAAAALDRENQDLMLVGHLPHLGRLASLLVCNNADFEVFSFQQGAVLCLECTPETGSSPGSWATRWMLAPELVASGAGPR